MENRLLKYDRRFVPIGIATEPVKEGEPIPFRLHADGQITCPKIIIDPELTLETFMILNMAQGGIRVI